MLSQHIQNIEQKSASATSPIEITPELPVSSTMSSAALPRFTISRFVHMLCHQPKSIEKDPSLEKAQIESTHEPENANDPDFWKSRITLSAFECWFEEFELSAPPFPYMRKWDPACKPMREKLSRKGKHKGHKKKKTQEGEGEERVKKKKARKGKKQT
jgi:hypothetical protein